VFVAGFHLFIGTGNEPSYNNAAPGLGGLRMTFATGVDCVTTVLKACLLKPSVSKGRRRVLRSVPRLAYALTLRSRSLRKALERGWRGARQPGMWRAPESQSGVGVGVDPVWWTPL